MLNLHLWKQGVYKYSELINFHHIFPNGLSWSPSSWTAGMCWNHFVVCFSSLSISRWARLAPTGSDCTSGKITEARWWSSLRTAPLSRTASTPTKFTPSTCWRAAGSSTRCLTTGGGSTCWGRGTTGATTTGAPQMPEWARWGGPWISTEMSSSSFLNLETNKIFSVCFWHWFACVFPFVLLLFFYLHTYTHTQTQDAKGNQDSWSIHRSQRKPSQ